MNSYLPSALLLPSALHAVLTDVVRRDLANGKEQRKVFLSGAYVGVILAHRRCDYVCADMAGQWVAGQCMLCSSSCSGNQGESELGSLTPYPDYTTF